MFYFNVLQLASQCIEIYNNKRITKVASISIYGINPMLLKKNQDQEDRAQHCTLHNSINFLVVIFDYSSAIIISYLSKIKSIIGFESRSSFSNYT